MGRTRSIRLKEYDPNVERQHIPTGALVEASDETLQNGPFRLRTDEHGFIVTGNTVADDAKPIAVIGGSFVESSWVHEDKRFVSQAERLMPGYRFLNGGYSGSTTLQLYNVMLNKIYPIIGEYGTLVFFVGQSDSDVTGRAGGYWNDTQRWAPVIPGFHPETTLPSSQCQLRQLVELTIQAASIMGINLILVSSPYRDGDFSNDPVLRRRFRRNRDAFNEKKAEQDAIQQTTIEVGSEYGMDVIDFQSLTGGNPGWFYDALHLNEYGQTEFSKLFVQEVTRRL